MHFLVAAILCNDFFFLSFFLTTKVATIDYQALHSYKTYTTISM